MNIFLSHLITESRSNFNISSFVSIGPTFFVQALTYDPLHMVLLEMHRVSLKFVVHMLKNATYGKNGRLNVLVDFPIGLDFSK